MVNLIKSSIKIYPTEYGNFNFAFRSCVHTHLYKHRILINDSIILYINEYIKMKKLLHGDWKFNTIFTLQT